MEIISQHTKKIMEECKARARDQGLIFADDTLEYIVTNQDMIELSPKGMIPTLYDYWVNDLEVIRGRKEYELYPNNPYETVINSRPALSFYNDNNPDWMNVMIFYHVLGHMDFMQNNMYFRKTWDDDFVGTALADKRLISSLRSVNGRWVDYVIEFTRGIDNLCGYYKELNKLDSKANSITKIDYYFDIFLQKVKGKSIPEYLKEIERYNSIYSQDKNQTDSTFLSEVKDKFPEFNAMYERHRSEQRERPNDVIRYIMEYSPFINREENRWMKLVMEIVRNTSLYFEPQRRTKTINEGWATFWHNKLFLCDKRMETHEAEFARLNAYVAAVPRVGYNPYAIGYSLFDFLVYEAGHGRLSYSFDKIFDTELRKNFDLKTGSGLEYIFNVRKNFCDFTFINTFVNQDFTDRYNLVLIGNRINETRMTREYYIKSRKASDYKEYLINHIIHPPHITVDRERTEKDGILYLTHHFEGKQLIPEFIDNTIIGIEYLWGGEVRLSTNIIKKSKPVPVVYVSKNRKVVRNAA